MKNKKLIIILSICIMLLTASTIFKTFENDTFFTIPTGNYILKNGINEVEPFTWHENLKFTKLRWGFDVVIATIYNITGFTGLYIFTIVISVLIGISLFLTLVKRKNNPIIAFLVTLLIMNFMGQNLTCRGQIMSYLFFVLEIYSIQMLLETGKKRYSIYLVLISFGILTFHSSVWLAHFLFYAPYIAEWLLVKIKINTILVDIQKIELEERTKNTMKLFFITMGNVLITGFLTPLKLTPFTYMFKVMGGFSSQIINELQKLNITKSTELMIIISIIVGLLSITKTKIKFTDICLVVGLIIMSKLAVRNLYIALSVLAFPICSLITSFINAYEKQDIMEKFAEILNKSFFLLIIIVLGACAISVNNYKKIYKQPYVNPVLYPIEAAKFIKENIDMENMRLYNHFNFGSYLELQGIPTFMDSRSEVYCEEFSNVEILKDFANFDIYADVKPEYMIEKYGITHFIFTTSNGNGISMKNSDKYNVLYDDGAFIILEVAKTEKNEEKKEEKNETESEIVINAEPVEISF